VQPRTDRESECSDSLDGCERRACRERSCRAEEREGHDSGDIAYEWKRSEKGSYGLGIDVAVKSVAGAAKK